MSKYYSSNISDSIPDKVHVIYGTRQSGKTYYEFNKKLQAKEMFEEYNLKQKICRFQRKIISISYISEMNYKPQVRFDLKRKNIYSFL